MFVTFRLDESVPGVSRETVKEFLAAYPHFVVREISEKTKKPHYQGYVSIAFTHKTMQNHITAKWPGAKSHKRGGENKYSCSPVKDLEAYRRYLCKGTEEALPDVVSTWQLDMTDDVVERLHREHHGSAPAQSKKIHIVKRGIDHFKSFDWGGDDVYGRRRQVLEWMMEQLHGAGHDEYRIGSWLNGILNGVDEEHQRQFITRVVNRHT